MRTVLVSTDLLADIERDNQPILITQHGLPSAYLIDVESCRREQERMSILEGIARGEMAAAERHTLSHEQAGNNWQDGSNNLD